MRGSYTIIAFKELREIVRDSRWMILVTLFVLFLGSAVVLGWDRYQRVKEERLKATAADRKSWVAQGEKNPHSAAHFGQYAFKPIGILEVVEPGVSEYVGSSILLEAHKQNEEQGRSARDRPMPQRLGQWSVAFLFQSLLPLLAILLSWDAITREREQGTLNYLIGLGVNLRSLLVGKMIAGFVLTLAFLAFGFATFTVVMAMTQSDAIRWDPRSMTSLVARGSFLLATYVLYLVGFFAFGLGVSVACRSSRTSLMILLGFWCANCFIAPRIASDVIAHVDPLPSSQAFREAIQQDKKKLFGHDEKHPAFIAFRERILKEYHVDRIEDLPVSFRGLSLREDDASGYKIFDKHFGELQTRIETQDRWRAYAGVAFPMLVVQSLSMAFSGTDSRHHHDFARAAEQHRRIIQDAASQHLIDHARNGDNSYVAPRHTWEKIPAFAYDPPSVTWTLRSCWREWIVLACWLSLCLGFAHVMTSRWRAKD
jgi:ABC-2 type transport system permease protein